MKPTLRIVTRNFHVWAGLTLGLLFCLMGLSGSLIVYRDSIEAALRPEWKATSHSRPESVLAEADARIGQRWPDAVRSRITFPQAGGEPYEYQIRVHKMPIHVYFDATTGELLGTWNLPWLEWITGLHQNLLLPPEGRQLVGFIGIGLFFSSLSGLTIWMLRSQSWKAIFRISWRASWNKVNFDLHRSIGVVANALLLVISFTGICLGFPDTFRAFAETVTGTSAARMTRISVQSSDMAKPLDAYLQAALGAVPGGTIRELRFPQEAGRPAVARIWLKGDYREDGSNNQVTLDPASARVLGVDAAANWTPARRIAALPAPIHYAEWGGPAVKMLWCLTGLTPSFLFLSGVWFWMTGYRARQKAATQKNLADTRAEADRVLTHQ